ncbi:MAG: GTPase HflX [Deltaproteobacteria bacterium]|jgi:GTP-binding protein HflX|nr:GTPase HflX [Deltaproteobacteria bacterium]MBW2531043.1 GTPase HflX [Deltaproteobacteria bacterium]
MRIQGNTTGLSPHATKTLERLYRRKVPLQHVATLELMKTLAEASLETHRQVGVLVHRSGQVDSVIVGDASRLMLPDIGRLRAAQGRLRALRLVHTHLFNEPLSRDDIVDLVRLRLDLVCALMLSPAGDLRGIHYAYNTPAHREGDPGYREVGPEHPGEFDLNFGELMAALEREFARLSRARAVDGKDGRSILVHVGERKQKRALDTAEARLRELEELARTAGVEVVGQFVQLRDKRDARFVVGKGKLEEILLRAFEVDASTLIFDHNLMPSQASAISRMSDLKVIDRTQLILDIFAQRAQSVDGKLQVELAQLKYALPRLAMKDDSLSRLTGGIGGRGPGETKLEVGRRRARERITSLEARLRKASKQRRQRRRQRQRNDVPIVSIVGYTNAGKSTLLNTLTDADGLVEDKLFATLDTRSRRLRFPEDREVIITDTVGFIRELPTDLFAAFRATFEEMADADLLLHVVDAVDADRDQQMETTESLLAELDLHCIPRLLVYNKADLLDEDQRDRILGGRPDAVLVSALERQSTHPLLALIASQLNHRWEQARKVTQA